MGSGLKDTTLEEEKSGEPNVADKCVALEVVEATGLENNETVAKYDQEEVSNKEKEKDTKNSDNSGEENIEGPKGVLLDTDNADENKGEPEHKSKKQKICDDGVDLLLSVDKGLKSGENLSGEEEKIQKRERFQQKRKNKVQIIQITLMRRTMKSPRKLHLIQIMQRITKESPS